MDEMATMAEVSMYWHSRGNSRGGGARKGQFLWSLVRWALDQSVVVVWGRCTGGLHRRASAAPWLHTNASAAPLPRQVVDTRLPGAELEICRRLLGLPPTRWFVSGAMRQRLQNFASYL